MFPRKLRSVESFLKFFSLNCWCVFFGALVVYVVVFVFQRESQRVDYNVTISNSSLEIEESEACQTSEANSSVVQQASLQSVGINQRSQAATPSAAKPLGAPSNMEISQLLNEARHKVLPINGGAAELEVNRGASHFMQNKAQSLTARFAVGGVRLGSSKDEAWQIALRYSGASDASKMEADGTRMDILHPDGVTEWYENSVEGIEHGFILGGRVNDTGTRDIHVSMEGMVATKSGDDLIWSQSDGTETLAYSGLHVNDATGAPIKAEMLAGTNGLIIRMNDANAVYPVYIDPLITRVTAMLSPINLGDGNAGDSFGTAISTDGQTLVAGAPRDNSNGSAYIFARVAGEWVFKKKLNPTGTYHDMRFGDSVALQGDILVVGSPGDGIYGAAYIYEKVGDDWVLSTKVSPATGTDLYAYFGGSLALDNGLLMVGASGYTRGGSPPVIGKGYVFVFENVAGIWTQRSRLEDSAGTTSDEYGAAIVIKNGYAYIGKPGKNSGEVMIYRKDGSSWTYVTRLFGVSPGDRFGRCLATDGSALAVGAPFHDAAVGVDAGSVDVFRKSGEVWTSESKLTAADGVSYDYFGTSVAIEGNRLLIGAIRGYSSHGCGYIFEKNTSWSQKTRLVPYNTTIDGRSGYCVALVGDAAWVGAYNSDTYAHWHAGVINEYRLQSGMWNNTDLITAGNGGSSMAFGSALDMDGQRIVVGVPADASPYGQGTGSVYVFLKANSDWQIETVLTEESPWEGENFGAAVDIEGDLLMVGIPGDTKLGNTVGYVTRHRFGSVTCFRRSASGWSPEAKMQPTIPSAFDGDSFGTSISLRGSTLLVGAPQYTIATPIGGGTSYETPGGGFVFGMVNGAWVQQARLIVPGSSSYWKVGSSVALGDGRLFLSAPQCRDANFRYGRIFEFTGSGTTWTVGNSIVPSAWEGYETFGSSIALDGDCLVVGSWSDYAGAGQRAYVFRRSGSAWQQEAILLSPDAEKYKFGSQVAVKGDLAVVSDTRDLVLGQAGGSIHIFRKQGGIWSRTQKLFASEAGSLANFGSPIVTDGVSVLAAAPNATVANPITGDLASYRGSVYLFELGESHKKLEVMNRNNFTGEDTNIPRVGHTLSFPWTVVGSNGHPETLVIRNNGVAPISGISITISGVDASQFALNRHSLASIPTTLSPGGVALVNLTFSPSVTGVNKFANLRVSSDDGQGDYQIGIHGLANTKPQKTGGAYTCFAGQACVIFAEDLAIDPDGHSFSLNSFPLTQLTGAAMSGSGNSLTFVPSDGFIGDIIFWYYITDEYGSYDLIVNTMTVLPAPFGDDGLPSVLPVKRLDSNTLGILLKGEAGNLYQIQRSYDLNVWESLGSATLTLTGDLMIMDYQNNDLMAFYRLLKQ